MFSEERIWKQRFIQKFLNMKINLRTSPYEFLNQKWKGSSEGLIKIRKILDYFEEFSKKYREKNS
jgi:hypothetical protein